jgi:2-polyprenyl-3-methyl-5-hydroxy-6-metoxy-1,4-benzoquinol methylase
MTHVWDEWNIYGGPKYPLTPLVQFVFREFDAKVKVQDKVALDLGCGSGVHTEFLVRHNFDTYAVDFSDVAITNTQKRLDSQGLSAHLQVKNVTRTDLPSNFFDLIVCVDVLECLDNVEFERAICEIDRLLKPQGKAFLFFCGEGDFRISESNYYQLRGISEDEILLAVSSSKSTRRFELDLATQTYKHGLHKRVNHVISVGPQI